MRAPDANEGQTGPWPVRAMTPEGPLIQLDVPAETESLLMVRCAMAATVVEHHPGVSMGFLDDLRLTVDELATALLDAAPEGARLSVALRHVGNSLMVTGRAAAGETHPRMSPLGATLVRGCCADHHLTRRGADLMFSCRVVLDGR